MNPPTPRAVRPGLRGNRCATTGTLKVICICETCLDPAAYKLLQDTAAARQASAKEKEQARLDRKKQRKEAIERETKEIAEATNARLVQIRAVVEDELAKQQPGKLVVNKGLSAKEKLKLVELRVSELIYEQQQAAVKREISTIVSSSSSGVASKKRMFQQMVDAKEQQPRKKR